MNIVISALIALTLSVGGWFGLQEVSPQFGAFSDPFVSIQLAPNPSNGDCLTTDGSENAWEECATGGGGGAGGTWSTTTSEVAGVLFNYPNNDDDVVLIGSNASTSAEFWFDPNNPTYPTHYKLLGNLLGNNSSTTIINLVSTNATATNATNTNLNVSGVLDVDNLTSALTLTGATGIFAEYTGTSCTNQFVRVLSALGVATCESIGNEDFEDDDWGDISVATNVVSVEDDSHAHTSTSLSGIDISADTNLTAGDALTLTDDDIDFDGGTAPGGELGGTWATPTIDDSLAVTSWNLTTPTFTTSFTFDSVTINNLTGVDTNLVTGTAGASGNCAEWDANGDLVDAGAECGTGGGGSGGGTWSTTTSQVAGQLINYPNNDDDVVAIGANSSTTAEFWFDPNIGKAMFGTGAPTIAFDGANGSTTLQKFTATHGTTTQATSTDLHISSFLNFGGVVGNSWDDFCASITGGAGLCDGADATGSGSFPFDVTGYGVSTSTTVGFTGGIITTASSTMTATTSMKAVNFNANREDVSASESVGGVVNINRSTNLGPGLVAYTDAGTSGGRLGSFVCDNVNHDTQCLHVRSDSTLESTFNVLGSPAGKGIVKIGSNGVGDTDSSGLSIDTSLSSFTGQGIFLKGNATGKLLNFRGSDNTEHLTMTAKGALGLGTTTPYFQFQVASSTGSQIALSSADATSHRFNFRAIGDNFYFATSSPSTFATSSTPIFSVDSTNTVTFGNRLPTCIALTGAAGLCDGDDGGGAGGGIGDPFTHTSFGGVVTSATSTLIHLTATTPHSLVATSTYANNATSSQFTIGAYGTNVGIYFTEDGDGALTIQGIGNSQNESITVNLDDNADIALWSSATGVTGFDYSSIRGRWDGLVIDGDATYPASSDGSLLIGDGTDGGTFEMEDGPACIGDGGCTPDSADGSLTLANNLFMPSAGVFNFGAGDVTLTHSSGALTLSADLFDLGAAVLEIPNGSGPTVDAIGELALDSTNDQLIYFGASKRVLQPYDNLGFAYATTTWSATTTLRVGPAPAAITVYSALCETNTGTVGVSLYDGTNRALYMPTASTTINEFLYTASNNSFTKGETIRVDIGTPASSPTQLSCRFLYTYDAT